MRELRNTKIIAVDAVEYSLKQSLPLFLSGLTAGMVQREPQIRASFPAPENSQPDSDGHVFIYFTIEALAEVLHKSQMTVKTALAVLEKQELIFRKRQGPGQPNRIYVKLPKETIHYTDRFLSLR